MLNVFDIQRGSYHDGPGIRTVVFLKGCNLSCHWCQNPESQSVHTDIMYFKNKCIGCGACAEVCPCGCISLIPEGLQISRAACKHCGLCADHCYSGALERVGKMMTPEEVLDIVRKDQHMYKLSRGGMTLSGGDPLLQSSDCLTLLQLAKEEGIDTAIETAGNVRWDIFASLLPYLNHVIMDLKTLNEEKHQAYCGVSNKRIMDNLRKLSCMEGFDILIRTPVIPKVNDRPEDIEEIATFLKQCGLTKYELLPYHEFGLYKYEALGKTCKMEKGIEITKDQIQTLRKIAQDILEE